MGKISNIVIALVVIAVWSLTGCKKNELTPLVGVDRDEIELFSGDTTRITPYGGTGVFFFSSANEYIATISGEGVITAGKIGNTHVRAISIGSFAAIEVTVKPRSVLYEELITDWKIKLDKLVDSVGRAPDAHQGDSVIYFYPEDLDASAITATVYMFADSVLNASAVVVKEEHNAELEVYLGERFVLLDRGKDSGLYEELAAFDRLYINVLRANIDKATMIVGVQKLESGESAVYYFSVQISKASARPYGIPWIDPRIAEGFPE